METVKGYNMVLAVGGSIIACSRECSLIIDREMIEIAGATATAREYIPGRYQFSISTSGLYAIDKNGNNSTKDIASKLIAGTKVSIALSAFEDNSGKCDTYTGYAYVTSLSASGSYNQRSTYSISLQGTGALAISRSTKEQLSWNPVFQIVYEDGSLSYKFDEKTTEAYGDVVVETSQGDCEMTLRCYPNLYNYKEATGDIQGYEQFGEDINMTDISGEVIHTDDIIVHEYNDYIDYQIVLSQWQTQHFFIEFTPDPGHKKIEIILT